MACEIDIRTLTSYQVFGQILAKVFGPENTLYSSTKTKQITTNSYEHEQFIHISVPDIFLTEVFLNSLRTVYNLYAHMLIVVAF